jgi:signal transduction histidine kinase
LALGISNRKFITIFFIILVAISYAIIHYCAMNDSLPQTQFPDNFITRPYDVIPLILFVFAGIFLFPRYYKRHPSIFTFTLAISMIPDVVVEMHMAFGSSALFDNHFNIAHFLKIVAYAVPLAGLLLDYAHTYQAKEREIAMRQVSEKYTHELERSNKDLDDFAYVASHDLKAPLRGIMQLANWIEEDIQDIVEDETKKHLNLMQNRVARLEKLLDDLLAYSRVGRQKGDISTHV